MARRGHMNTGAERDRLVDLIEDYCLTREGAEAAIDAVLDDPASVLDALVAQGGMARFYREIVPGLRIEQWECIPQSVASPVRLDEQTT